MKSNQEKLLILSFATMQLFFYHILIFFLTFGLHQKGMPILGTAIVVYISAIATYLCKKYNHKQAAAFFLHLAAMIVSALAFLWVYNSSLNIDNHAISFFIVGDLGNITQSVIYTLHVTALSIIVYMMIRRNLNNALSHQFIISTMEKNIGFILLFQFVMFFLSFKNILVFQYFFAFFLFSLISITLANNTKWGKSSFQNRGRLSLLVGFILFISSLILIILRFFLNDFKTLTDNTSRSVQNLLQPIFLKFEALIKYLIGNLLSYNSSDQGNITSIQNSEEAVISNDSVAIQFGGFEQLILLILIVLLSIGLLYILIKQVSKLTNFHLSNTIQIINKLFINLINKLIHGFKLLHLIISSRISFSPDNIIEQRNFKAVTILGAFSGIEYFKNETPYEYSLKWSKVFTDYSEDIDVIVQALYNKKYSNQKDEQLTKASKRAVRNIFSFNMLLQTFRQMKTRPDM